METARKLAVMEAYGESGDCLFDSWPPWTVRIRDAAGAVVGAGLLLAPDTVLTCAHVVPDGADCTVELPGGPGDEPVALPASVSPGAFVPPATDDVGDPSGDVALLHLGQTPSHPRPVQLTRLSTSGRRVWMYGFPAGFSGGLWFRATTVGGAGRDGRVQLRPEADGELPVGGCSGAGVVDYVTRQVIGMLVSNRVERKGSGFAFMTPTETIVRHLPQLGPLIRGRSAVDPSLRSGADAPLGDGPFAERLARWFRGDGQQVKISLVRAEDPKRSGALRRAITLADRELRTSEYVNRVSGDPPETVPWAGGHDLALNVAGLTAEQVAEAIAERTGLWQDPAVPAVERIRTQGKPLSLVAVGVDEAADPDALLDLLALLHARDCRLLLIFRRPDEHYRRAETELVLRPRSDGLRQVSVLLGQVTGPLATALARHTAEVRADVGDALKALKRAAALQGFLSETSPSSPLLGHPSDLTRHERTARRAHALLTEAVDRLDRLVALRRELSGRLVSYNSLLHAHFQEPAPGTDPTGPRPPEQPDTVVEAAELYRAADRLLTARPCDVAAAEAAVDAYTAFVDRAIRERADRRAADGGTGGPGGDGAEAAGEQADADAPSPSVGPPAPHGDPEGVLPP